jgi:hypothetical protein
MKNIFKDVLSDLDIDFRSFCSNPLKKEVSEVISNGVTSVPALLAPYQCNFLRDDIDRCILDSNTNVWRDNINSDKRIYGFETISQSFHDIFDVEHLRGIGEAYLGRSIVCYFALAARLDAVAENIGSGGGWHRDSAFSHQFKVIVYLNDVSDENGPFQYLLGSHRTRSKFEEFGFKGLGNTRYQESKIEPFFERVQTFTGKEGDGLYVDTRGVHRGKPIARGARYAITFYFWTRSPGAKFNSYLQSELSILN